MYIFFISAGLLIPAIFYVWHLVKQRSKINASSTETEPAGTSTDNDEPAKNYQGSSSLFFNAAHLTKSNAAWDNLNNLSKLQFAILLIEKSLPVWEKFTGDQDVIYRDVATITPGRIDNKLLQLSVAEMHHSSLHDFPAFDNKKINHYFNEFVGPVIALQDGKWLPPYPVKKIFLAAYFTLKSILEQTNLSSLEFLLSTAITEALDCIAMSKLYNSEELLEILNAGADNFLPLHSISAAK